MNSARWQRVRALLEAALERPPDARDDYLDEACEGDAELRGELKSLLAHRSSADSFLEHLPVSGLEQQVAPVEKGPELVGRLLSHYQILSRIGAGGMGEVYEANDTRLDRRVAIKVLPSHVASNPDARKRFEREARAVSSLNHPHICTLYDVGSEDGIDFIVMEHIDGDTLARRLKKRPPPLEEALRYGVEIADALDKAHRQGVIHRDLKPGNIMLTKSGAKLLDFGLAKLEASPRRGLDPGGGESSTQESSLTKEGSILGTFQYMAPEQLEGRAVDARTDIFAFGGVLHEMVTGKKAFEADSNAQLIAAILQVQPPAISDLRPLAPPMLDRIVRKCLAKDPDDRWQSAHDLKDELTWASEAGLVTKATSSGGPGRKAIGSMLTALFLASTLVGVAVWNLKPEPPPRAPARFVLTTPREGPLRLTGSQTDVAISPDGARIVYMSSGGSSSSRRLYVRDLHQLAATPLSGSGRARSPFFSPNGEWVGFQVSGGTDDDDLKKVSVLGGPPVTVCQWESPLLGASWGPDGTIVFSTFDSTGLLRVAAVGGEPEELTKADRELGEVDHTWPEFLPGGDAILFNIVTDHPTERNQIAVLSLSSGEKTVLDSRGSSPRYVPTGHITYAVGETLWAVPFDLDRLAVTGDPVPVLEGLLSKNSGAVNFSFSGDGSLLYVSGTTASATQSLLVLVDRNGRATPLTDVTADYLFPRFSPDGRHVAFAVAETEGALADWRVDVDIWVIELESGLRTRLTAEGDNMLYPTWSPDGSRVAYTLSRLGRGDFYSVSLAGNDLPEELFSSDGYRFMSSWASDGRTIAFHQFRTDSERDLWVLSLDGDPTPSIFLASQFDERAGVFSPDGRFMAYVSDQSGQAEVYVRQYPGPGGEVVVSTGGGTEPVWARDGTELFYRKGEQILVTRVETEGTFSAGPATVIFEGSYERADRNEFGGNSNYDVSPDGQQFVMVRRTGNDGRVAPQMNVVLDWFDELKRLAPASR